jgi:hypothetical protein
LLPKILVVSASPSAAVAIGDAGVRVQVVHVRGVHQPVHGRVDGRRGAALAVQAVIKRRHHLVLALHPGVDVLQRLQPVQAQDRKVLCLQGAEVTAGALHPEELDVLAGDRVRLGALRGRVAAGEVGVPLVRAQAVGTGDQVFNSLVLCHFSYAPHPDCWPPTRSSLIFFW